MVVKRLKGTEIRRYRNDNGDILGIAGTVEELERADILKHDSKGKLMPPDSWCCIDSNGRILDFVGSKEAAKLVFMELC